MSMPAATRFRTECITQKRQCKNEQVQALNDCRKKVAERAQVLRDKGSKSSEEEEELQKCETRIDQIDDKITAIEAAYLREIAVLLEFDKLVTTLQGITQRMQAKVEEMKTLADVVGRAASVLAIADEAIDAINRVPE